LTFNMQLEQGSPAHGHFGIQPQHLETVQSGGLHHVAALRGMQRTELTADNPRLAWKQAKAVPGSCHPPGDQRSLNPVVYT